MKAASTLLYGVTILAVLIAGLVIPYLMHRSGTSAVPGWAGLVMPGAVSPKHTFIASQCESCHTPHVGVEAKTCIACHANAPAILTKQSTRFHATIGECRGCHVEHEGATRPITMDHTVLALVGSEKALKGNGGATPRPTDELMRFAEALGLRPDRRNGLSQLNCADCHSNKDPHIGLFGSECASCHDVTRWSVTGFRHPSPASTDCAQCHQAPPSHYMGHFQMVSQKVARQEHASVEQCYLCHTTDAWNSIRGVGWYKHH